MPKKIPRVTPPKRRPADAYSKRPGIDPHGRKDRAGHKHSRVIGTTASRTP